MGYNTGRSDRDFYNNDEQELKQRAKDYSEGNMYLETLLLNSWKNGIETIGCCVGHPLNHDECSDGYGYFAFELNNDSSFKFFNMIYKYIGVLNQNNISMFIDDSVSISFPMEFSNKVFNLLLELSTIISPISNDELNEEPMIRILRFLKDIDMEYELKITNDEIFMYAYNLFKTYNLDINLIKSIEEFDELQIPFLVKFNSKNIDKVVELFRKYSLDDTKKSM